MDVRARPADSRLDREVHPLRGTVCRGHREKGHGAAQQERDREAGTEPDRAPGADRGEPLEERVQPSDAVAGDPLLDVTVEAEQRLGRGATHG